MSESANMAEIFSGSLVTFCAASDVGSEGGLFNEYSSTAFDHPDVRPRSSSSSVRFVRSSGEVSTLHFVNQNRTSWDCRNPRTANCLERRVWCFQEDLLSPRKLYYYRDQLYWQCDHVIASEDRLIDALPELNWSFAPGFGPKKLDPDSQDFPERASKYWYIELMSQRYSARETTYESDRLVAVSGLAKRVGAAVRSRYLAGLWESTLMEGLRWSARTPLQTKTNYAPSWSWASQQGGFEWMNLGKMTPVCTILRAEITYTNPQDLFGGVTHGAIRFRGRLLSAIPQRRGCELPLLQNAFVSTTWDDHRFDATDVRIFALPLGTRDIDSCIRLLLVTASASDSGKYVRVGCGFIQIRSTRDTESYPRWVSGLESLPETEITSI
jgi:hypothetical protein